MVDRLQVPLDTTALKTQPTRMLLPRPLQPLDLGQKTLLELAPFPGGDGVDQCLVGSPDGCDGFRFDFCDAGLPSHGWLLYVSRCNQLRASALHEARRWRPNI